MLSIDIYVNSKHYYLMPYSHLQSIEIFHLLFLRHLGEKLDKKLYALKGGCNLRFFMKSLRYSEDMDMDIHVVAKETLRNKVRKILTSRSLLQTLEAKGIHLQQFSEPKQTETTQRWKISLVVEKNEMPLPTKIEFSRRKITGSTQWEAIDPEILHAYQMYPILVHHYTKETAFLQKVEALAHRKESQARDLFDMKLLIDAGAQWKSLKFDKTTVKQATQNAMRLDFSAFKGQVLAFLMPEYQTYFHSEKIWEELLQKVVKVLGGLPS